MEGDHQAVNDVFDFDVGFDDFEPLEPVDFEPPCPPDPREPRRRGGPAPEPSDWAISGLMLGSLVILGLLKFSFFLGSSFAVTLATSILFVAAHGAFITIGATWFWGYRYP